ncbi:MAG: hypothetical protein AAFN08_16495 [Cyanobacteria bacterium J06559_3]
MAIHNPLSRTHIKVTRDRLQHYSNDRYACTDCGHRYQPKVHSQPYIVQFGAILAGFALYLVFKLQAPPWLYGLLPAFILGYMVWYYKKDQRLVTPGRNTKIRYGDIVLDCPQCGGTSAERVPGR